MSLRSKEEQYQEWLDREEIPVEETVEYERFQKYLAEEMGYSDAQINALWGAVEYKFEDLATIGIRIVTYVYQTGPRAGQREARYVIEGESGLWSYVHMTEFAEAKRRGD